MSKAASKKSKKIVPFFAKGAKGSLAVKSAVRAGRHEASNKAATRNEENRKA
jgi:hypothetical protein